MIKVEEFTWGILMPTSKTSYPHGYEALQGRDG
jgi:hypothetical protein